jgi:hypothetical protein
MKKIMSVLFLILSVNTYANCNIFLQYETYFKENERGIAFDVLSKQLDANGHTIVGSLEKADAILKISSAPTLQNQKFIYLTTLKYIDTLGSVINFSGRGITLSDSLKSALVPMDKCQP